MSRVKYAIVGYTLLETVYISSIELARFSICQYLVNQYQTYSLQPAYSTGTIDDAGITKAKHNHLSIALQIRHSQ